MDHLHLFPICLDKDLSQKDSGPRLTSEKAKILTIEARHLRADRERDMREEIKIRVWISKSFNKEIIAKVEALRKDEGIENMADLGKETEAETGTGTGTGRDTERRNGIKIEIGAKTKIETRIQSGVRTGKEAETEIGQETERGTLTEDVIESDREAETGIATERKTGTGIGAGKRKGIGTEIEIATGKEGKIAKIGVRVRKLVKRQSQKHRRKLRNQWKLKLHLPAISHRTVTDTSHK